jgi:hypothetical protein
MTTTNLNHTPRRRWYDLPVPVAIAICLFSLLTIAALVGRIRSAPPAAAVPTPALSVTHQAPIVVVLLTTTPMPVLPTATPQVIYVEVPAPPPPPEVVYVEVPQPVYAPVEAAPTPAPEQYQLVSEPPALQTLAQPASDESLSPALLREAQDK